MKSSTGEAESLAEAIEETDNRALGDMRAFIRILADSDATCSLSFEGESFRFDSASDVQKALNNLSQDNVVEGEVDIRGHFQGYLPKVRRAEFVNEDTQEIITARVDRVVHDAERINSILGENVSIRARTRRVGSSSPVILFCNSKLSISVKKTPRQRRVQRETFSTGVPHWALVLCIGHFGN